MFVSARALPEVWGAKVPIHAAPSELARSFGVVATINMALLTELDWAPRPEMRARCGEDWRTPKPAVVLALFWRFNLFR